MSFLLFSMRLFLAMALQGAPDLAPAVAVDDDPIEVDLLYLTTIEYEEGTPLPAEIRELDGKKVFIWGWMSTDTLEGTTEFLLITDQCGCDGPPKLQHFVDVNMGDRVIGYRPEKIKVTGTFSVGELVEDDFVVSIYRLEAEDIE